ncbi:hypothetical protein KL919_004053 [Ogataea angusta]|nr:hypothetical protein KL919_004053 [Ogataea angusta]
MIRPMMVIILMEEIQNSTSPKNFTAQKLSATHETQKMEMKMATLASVQAGSKRKRLVARVALTQSVHRGLAGNGDIRNHLAELVHDAPDEERQNQVADQQACGSARRQRRAGTDKDTRSDGSSERDQLDVSALETTVDLGELLFLGHNLLGEEVIGLLTTVLVFSGASDIGWWSKGKRSGGIYAF